MKIIRLFLLSLCAVQIIFVAAYAQTDSVSSTRFFTATAVRPDTALYDKYGLNYRFSQFMKYSIRYGSIGAVTGTGLAGSYLLANKIDDGIAVGILTASGAIVGGGIGFITGAVVGVRKGIADEKIKQQNPDFYHKQDRFGYAIGGSASMTDLLRAGGLFSVSMQNAGKGRPYPDRYYLSFEYFDWNGEYYYSANSHYSSGANEYRIGIGLRYYTMPKAILNFYYEPGLGISFGNFYEHNYNYNNGNSHKSKDYFKFVYADFAVGLELNMFDFFRADVSLLFEPLGAYYKIPDYGFSMGNNLMIKGTFGTYIF